MEPIQSYPRMQTRVDMEAIRAETGVSESIGGLQRVPLGPSPKLWLRFGWRHRGLATTCRWGMIAYGM